MFGFKSKKETESETGENLFSRILLVVDGSEPSIAAAHYAVNLAAQSGGELTAVNVVDTATMDYLMQMHIFIKEEREEFEKDLERTGGKYLEFVSAVAGKAGLEINSVQKRGAYHKMILQEARQLPAGVIVIGGWKKTMTRKDAAGVERQLILDEASCPVIVIKSDDK